MILVIGKGHLGKIIAESLGASLCDGRLEDVPDLQLDYATCVINTAGKTDLPWCEENKEEASHVNSYLPVQLARRCKKFGTNFIQLSSGCVWNGPYDENKRPFTPTSPASPACHYTVTKVGCDEGLLQEMKMPGSKIAILRLRMPFSHVKSPRNLFTKLLGYKDLLDTPNSVTSSDVLCKTVKSLTFFAASPLWNRITCVYDLGTTSPYKIGQKLARTGLREAPGILSKANLDTWHKPRRVDTVMYDDVFETAIRPESVDKMLDETIRKYAND